MAEMLENQSVLIRYRDFHVHASFQIKHPIFCYVQNMLRLRLCRVSAFVIFRTAAPAMLRCAGQLLCRKRHARELAAEFFKRRAIDGVVHEITALFAASEISSCLASARTQQLRRSKRRSSKRRFSSASALNIIAVEPIASS